MQISDSWIKSSFGSETFCGNVRSILIDLVASLITTSLPSIPRLIKIKSGPFLPKTCVPHSIDLSASCPSVSMPNEFNFKDVLGPIPGKYRTESGFKNSASCPS